MSSKNGTALLLSAISLYAFAAPQAANAQEAPEATSNQAVADIADIVVTARRREESLQTVPLSISAFSGETLEKRNVKSFEDVKSLTGGLTFNVVGGASAMELSLRGIGQLPSGLTTPGVVTYVNDIPLPSLGSNLATYDLANIQVLKGPQGTLFGKNTLGGAILVNTAPATDKFEGYVRGTYARYDFREIEGALNIPFGDFGALRLAGQMRRQDPRIKAIDAPAGGGTYPGFSNIHQDSFRATLKLRPFDGLESDTVVEYSNTDQLSDGLYLSINHYNPTFAALFPPVLSAAITQLQAQSQAAADIQAQNRFAVYDGGVNGGYIKNKYWSVTNKTSLELSDSLTVRNIFGYRDQDNSQFINTGGTPTLFVTDPFFNVVLAGLPADTTLPFILFWAGADRKVKFINEEFQVLGNFDWGDAIAGFFYNQDKPAGPSGNYFTAFAFGGLPSPSTTNHFQNKSTAVYAQVGIKLTPELKLNLGGRYTWDKMETCGGTFFDGSGNNFIADYGACKTAAANNNTTDGIGFVSTKTSAPTWTVGLDYQVNPDLMLYITSRRGYRAGGVNSPRFETPFTTGGTGCLTVDGSCPDFTPFQTYGKETLTDVEVGEKWSFNTGLGHGRINVSAYYSKHKNAVQFINTTAEGLPQGTVDTPDKSSIAANIADFTYYGADIDIMLQPSPNFTFGFNGSITKTKLDSTELVQFRPGVDRSAVAHVASPTFSGSVNAAWTLPFRPLDGDLVLSGDVFMTADYAGQQGIQLPGYSVANMRLDWHGIGGTALELAVFVKNLFDNEYISGQSVNIPTFPISTLYHGAPRTAGVTAKYSF